MKLPLGVAALCILSGVAHAQDAESTVVHEQNSTEKVAQVEVPAPSNGPRAAVPMISGPDAWVPVKPPAEGSDIGALVKAVDFAKVYHQITTGRAPTPVIIPEAATATVAAQEDQSVTSEERELKLRIKQAELELAENKAKQREIINQEIEKSLSMKGQDLTTVKNILKDRVITYSVKVYALTDDPLPPVAMAIQTEPRLISQGTVITTLDNRGKFLQSEDLRLKTPSGASNKDGRQKINSRFSIIALPLLTDSGRIASHVFITNQMIDDLTATSGKGADVSDPSANLIESDMSFISKVIDLMGENGDVHTVLSEKYKIVITASLD